MKNENANTALAEHVINEADNAHRRRQRPSSGALLRRRGIHGGLAALLFLAACAGSLGLVIIYHWPRVNVLVYYFGVRPSFVWFGMLFPALIVGAYSLRWRWFAVGCAIWLVGLCGTEEILQVAKPYPSAAREDFWVSRMAFRSYIETARPASGEIAVPLRVVTWNVRGGTLGAHGIASQLAGLDPDIVFLQEGSHGGRESLQEVLRTTPAFKDYHISSGHVAVLSRFPASRLESANGLEAMRGGVWRFDIAPGVAITGINVHLASQEMRTQLFRGWSVSQIQRLIQRSAMEFGAIGQMIERKRTQGPVLLAGDFNFLPTYPYLRRATAPLKDAFRENGYGWGKTVRPRIPVARIDMIFVPQDAHVYYASAVDTRYSDHRMTLAEVVVPVPVRREESGASDAAQAFLVAE